MSYSLSGRFRTKATALAVIAKDTGMPQPVKELLSDAIHNCGPDTDNTFLEISASGHTSHNLMVDRKFFWSS